MKLTFEEACMAVANVFSFAPDTWCRNSLSRRKGMRGKPFYLDPLDPTADQWCVQGGLCAAAQVSRPSSIKEWIVRLDRISLSMDAGCSADANNFGGRLVAIRMLRIASGELKP